MSATCPCCNDDFNVMEEMVEQMDEIKDKIQEGNYIRMMDLLKNLNDKLEEKNKPVYTHRLRLISAHLKETPLIFQNYAWSVPQFINDATKPKITIDGYSNYSTTNEMFDVVSNAIITETIGFYKETISSNPDKSHGEVIELLGLEYCFLSASFDKNKEIQDFKGKAVFNSIALNNLSDMFRKTFTLGKDTLIMMVKRSDLIDFCEKEDFEIKHSDEEDELLLTRFREKDGVKEYNTCINLDKFIRDFNGEESYEIYKGKIKWIIEHNNITFNGVFD